MPVEAAPRRESAKRAAKERSNIKLIAKREEEADENDFMDSDSDPAWTPQYKDDPEPDIIPPKKPRRGRPRKCYIKYIIFFDWFSFDFFYLYFL